MSHTSTPPDFATGAPPLFMPAPSRYAGEALDTSSRRSIVVRTPGSGDQLLDRDQDRTVVEYFYHVGQYWRAIVPLKEVDQVFGQAFNFSRPRRLGKTGDILLDAQGIPKRTIPVLNHLQARFTLKPGHAVELFPLGSAETTEPAHRLTDFIYSLEAVGPPGVSFNMRDALAGNLISAHRFLSTREMVFERIVVENQYVTETPPLPLGDEHKRMLLEKALQRSHAAGMTEPYYLYRILRTNNCTSNPFQMLDTVADYTPLQKLGSLLYRFPISPRLYLRVRGMDSDPSIRKLVKHEFDDYINDSATRKRKREYVRSKVKVARAARKLRETERG